jgi:hypothetical protein
MFFRQAPDLAATSARMAIQSVRVSTRQEQSPVSLMAWSVINLGPTGVCPNLATPIQCNNVQAQK